MFFFFKTGGSSTNLGDFQNPLFFFLKKFWSPSLAQRDITVYPTLRFGLVIKWGLPRIAINFSGFGFKSVWIYGHATENLKAGSFVSLFLK